MNSAMQSNCYFQSHWKRGRCEVVGIYDLGEHIDLTGRFGGGAKVVLILSSEVTVSGGRASASTATGGGG
jgi:hypothetical protein